MFGAEGTKKNHLHRRSQRSREPNARRRLPKRNRVFVRRQRYNLPLVKQCAPPQSGAIAGPISIGASRLVLDASDLAPFQGTSPGVGDSQG
jgi:hypothetical protein